MEHVVDIIVRAKDGHDLTEACLSSISANTAASDYRLILCDDGSDPAYDGDMAEFVLRSSEPRGAVSATNMGLGLSLQLPGEFVLVLDNDTMIPAGDREWLSRMLSEFEPGVGAVGATCEFAAGPQHILRSPQTYTGDWQGENGTGGLKQNPDVASFVSFAVMLRKDAVRQVGFWDERYNPGNWEDTDYAVQLRSAGWRIRVASSVYIHHCGHQTFREDIQRLLQENGQKFYDKWGPGRMADMGILPWGELKRMIQT